MDRSDPWQPRRPAARSFDGRAVGRSGGRRRRDRGGACGNYFTPLTLLVEQNRSAKLYWRRGGRSKRRLRRRRNPALQRHGEIVWFSPPLPSHAPFLRRHTSRGEDADLRQDPDGEDHHPRGGEQRHHRQRQGQNTGVCKDVNITAMQFLPWVKGEEW